LPAASAGQVVQRMNRPAADQDERLMSMPLACNAVSEAIATETDISMARLSRS
jgi:hypothetical protein